MNDLEIDVPAMLKNLERIRAALVKAEPGLSENHHNLVRVSVIEELITQALKYVDGMQ